MSRFSATLDKNAKGITLLSCIVMVIPFITIAQYFGATFNWLILIAPVVIIITFICCYLWRPAGYSLENNELLVHRIAGNLSFSVNDIELIEPFDVKEQGNGVRAFGSSGFFGYFGRFWYKKLGSVYMYATDKSKLLLVTLNSAPAKKHIIISPDDGEAFMKTFKAIRNQRATR
jgi:hypothetical protein